MKPRRRTFAFFAASLGFAALGGGAMLAAQTLDADDNRRRAVGDWLVEDVPDPNGGRMVRLVRETDEYSLDYHMLLGPGAQAGFADGYLVARLNCGQGTEGSIDGGRPYGDRDQVRAQLVDYLVRCEMAPEAAEEAVMGFERAFAVAAGWADERAVEMASLDMGMDMAATNAVDEMGMMAEMNATDMDMTMDMNATEMNMSTDMNATTDMNWTGDMDMDTNSSEPK